MNVDNLESAINDAKGVVGNTKPEAGSGEGHKMDREEEIGFHKGAFNTLIAERGELVKMLQNVESIARAHVKRLKELGVDVK